MTHQVTFSTTSITGQPQFSYSDRLESQNFSGNEIVSEVSAGLSTTHLMVVDRNGLLVSPTGQTTAVAESIRRGRGSAMAIE